MFNKKDRKPQLGDKPELNELRSERSSINRPNV